MAGAYPKLETERLVILLPGPDFSERVVDYYHRNREHLGPWEPQRGPEFFTPDWWRRQLELNQREFREDRGARMVVVKRGDPEMRVIGVVNLSHLVRGSFLACYLGYSIDHELQGSGVMAEALRAVLDYAFGELGLHRVMANYQPQNLRSGRLLQRLGFVREGYAADYLHIDGEWRDHVLTARTNPRWRS